MYAFTSKGHRRALASVLVATPLALALLMGAASAVAMETSKVTIDKDTGGQLSRITFEAKSTDPDGPVTEATLVFPPGFRSHRRRT